MGEFRKCPFCGGEITVGDLSSDFHYHEGMKCWYLFHSCLHGEDFKNGVGITICGKKQDVIDKWNGVYEVKKIESL